MKFDLEIKKEDRSHRSEKDIVSSANLLHSAAHFINFKGNIINLVQVREIAFHIKAQPCFVRFGDMYNDVECSQEEYEALIKQINIQKIKL